MLDAVMRRYQMYLAHPNEVYALMMMENWSLEDYLRKGPDFHVN